MMNVPPFYAQGYKWMDFHYEDGAERRVGIADAMTMRFDDGAVVMTGKEPVDSHAVSLAMEGLSHWSYIPKEGDVTRLGSPQYLRINIEGVAVRLSGLTDNCGIELYNINGRLLDARVVSRDCEIDCGEYGSGIYLLRVDGDSYKLIVD